MKLATIEIIQALAPHPNADAIELATVLGFQCVVRKVDNFKEGERIVFIQPDSVLPDKAWAEFYRSKSNRIKAIRLRGAWSEGVIESLEAVGYAGPIEIGHEISRDIGVTKYEPPAPQDLQAKGPLPHDIRKTDEERFNNIIDLPYGELVDVTLKIDGQSFSVYRQDGEMGVLGRTQEYKLDSDNNFTRNFRRLEPALKEEAWLTDGLCLRGEQYGQQGGGKGIQLTAYNPYSKMPLGVAFFGVWIIKDRCYANKGHELYIHDLLDFPFERVPVLERNVPLTPELIKKYAEDLTEMNGQPFEGVVIQHSKGSFKVMSKTYDSKK